MTTILTTPSGAFIVGDSEERIQDALRDIGDGEYRVDEMTELDEFHMRSAESPDQKQRFWERMNAKREAAS